MLQGGWRWLSSKRRIGMTHSYTADTAPGVSTEAAREQIAVREIEGDVRPVADGVQERIVVMQRDHVAGQAPTVGTELGRKMRTYMTALQSYKTAPIEAMKRLLSLRKAEAESAGGRDAEAKRKVVMKRKLSVEPAGGVDVTMCRENAMKRGHDADTAGSAYEDARKNAVLIRNHDADTAAGADVDVHRSMVTKVLVSGATWCDPEMLDGGVLYIRQAYYAEQNGNTLEVS